MEIKRYKVFDDYGQSRTTKLADDVTGRHIDQLALKDRLSVMDSLLTHPR